MSKIFDFRKFNANLVEGEGRLNDVETDLGALETAVDEITPKGEFADNAAALAGDLVVGDFYINTTDDKVTVVVAG